ncbi:hypothetical protein [Mycobacterium mantenii]|uniref:Uncharacterized protein n=1 Tax=Mycobacterium mantenii TaxID=560555 RepID=A0A1A2SQ35_MYCNT|nr:hypothetical protein [Mycobacterium mantenii]OBH45856.1 hypothetical protein A5688_06550 [Mycobacterium mantenii]OBH59946.1 hypothetical protein A5687_19655 [Mycobacterium mantenii]OBH66215.1 hypothetical protein A5683_10995 [Mycobacterium mantenii]OBH76300.1 hypothetical protein A5682_24570 [Mycobacterium mantenii]
MRITIKKAIAAFGGAAAVVLAVGFGPAGVSPADNAPPATMHSSSSAAPIQPGPAAAGVHVATLVGCVPGANC